MKEKERQHGQAAVLLALALVGMIAFAALAIDGGNAYFVQRNAQNASDAAAYAGSREVFIMRHVPGASCTSAGVITGTTCLLSVINEQAERNGVPDTGGEPFDAVNGNVEASYINKDYESIGGLLMPGHDLPGVDVLGVRVTTTIPFDTFIAGLIGRPHMAATTRSSTLLADKVNAVNNAIWADSDCTNGWACMLSGGFQLVDGGIHSNADLDIGGNAANPSLFTGTLEYVVDMANWEGSAIISPTVGNPVHLAEPEFLPELLDIDDYDYHVHPELGEPGHLDGDGYYYYDEVVGVPEMVFESGLHFSADKDGLDMGKGESDAPMLITVVSIGKVVYQIPDANVSLLAPYVDGVLIFSTAGEKNCPILGSDTAIQMSVSEATWEGFIYAPDGLVDMSFGQNSAFFGCIVGWEVAITGSEFTLTYDPAYDPDLDPLITLIE